MGELARCGHEVHVVTNAEEVESEFGIFLTEHSEKGGNLYVLIYHHCQKTERKHPWNMAKEKGGFKAI
jgi:hypothetical protein